MPKFSLNTVKDMFSGQKARYVGARLWQEIAGVAHDYWKDGRWEKTQASNSATNPDIQKKTATVIKTPPRATGKFDWHAQPGEISEKMWGEGFVTPGDEYLTDRLVRPLGLNKDMSLLDLSAGLGTRLRKTLEDFELHITGMEPDAAIAARAMEFSVAAGNGKQAAIAAYDPMKLSLSQSYDCVIMRETIYRVPDKASFIKMIVASCKPRAQVSFTDYIINPEMRDRPALAAWRSCEKGADPVGLVEMAELWAKVGISLRVHDDQTVYYKEEVKNGLGRLATFMASGATPDKETKIALQKRITTWAMRMAALNAGMKFYRFYGLR